MPVSGVLAPVPKPFDEHDHVDLVRLRAAFGRWVASPPTSLGYAADCLQTP